MHIFLSAPKYLMQVCF